jgi:hypothetical protein
MGSFVKTSFPRPQTTMVFKFLSKIEICNKGKFFYYLIWEENEQTMSKTMSLNSKASKQIYNTVQLTLGKCSSTAQ